MNLFVVSAPSGAGKTSLLKTLVNTVHQLQVCVSHTTRPKRPGEIDGVHYHFVDHQTFHDLIQAGAFIEYATVFDHYYGTHKDHVQKMHQTGNDMLLEIDWQGAQQVRQTMPHAISIFIIPPSLRALKERLTERKQDTPSIIHQRMVQAQQEISHFEAFDYLVINDDFSTALKELQTIIETHRLTLAQQKIKHAALLAALLE